ncbi:MULTISPECIES: hypothetical protein [Pandoraea]|uniref:Uncharacterized protein n=2 Tax=Pandoraea TaxID=93217 RepID=A0A5E4XM94_9BURK|nr:MULTISPECIES: hypothetical protein [Pandoraea]VVE14366.1 hypothetical protein PCE31107_02810 [Pandoraea cepalis]VVE37258.1 hypothetical protein PTE31013_03994 [Pandoraea terrigena]
MAHLVLQKQSDNSAASGRIFSVCLAVAATLTSLFITVIASEERGATWAEKAVWVATGVVILLAAHLLPALTKGARMSVKGMALPIWIAALLATGYTHATFFLNAQGRVGEQRASDVGATMSVPALPSVHSLRSRTKIAADVATTLRNLALLDIGRCGANCGAVNARRKALSARLEALRIEDAEAVRAEKAADARMAAVDRSQKAQDNARVDPFVANLAAVLRLRTDLISLIMAIVLGWLVDAVAVVSWASVARSRPGAVVPEIAPQAPVAAPVLRTCDVSGAAAVVGQAAANEPLLHEEFVAPSIGECEFPVEPAVAAATAQEEELASLADLAVAIRAGRVKSTLSSIRAHLGCTDGAAMALRRRLAEEHPDLFRPVSRLC